MYNQNIFLEIRRDMMGAAIKKRKKERREGKKKKLFNGRKINFTLVETKLN